MDIRFLQSFVATVESGSIAEAARRLDMTAAAVAARLKALEDELGAPLLQRSGRTVKPTAAGINILKTAKSMLREERDMRALANPQVQLGELRLGTFVSALTTVLPPVLKRMYESHPNLSVSVVSDSSEELCRMVAAGDLDAAVVVEPQFAISKTCEWRVLMEEPLVVVVPSHLAHEDPHHLLRTQPYIQYDRSVAGGQLAERYLHQQGISPHRRLEINGLMSIAAMVDQGLGISLLPDWSALWDRGLGIEKIPLPDPAPIRRTGYVWGLRRPHEPIARMFLQHAEDLWKLPRKVKSGRAPSRSARGA